MKIGMIVSTGFQLDKVSDHWEELIFETENGIIPFKVARSGGNFIYATTRNGFSTCCPPPLIK